MNCLVLTLLAEPEVTLPIAYQTWVQAALYTIWRERFPQLHEEGFGEEGTIFRFFTFSPLQGLYTVTGGNITFRGAIQLEVRSPMEELLEELADWCCHNGVLRLGRHHLPVINLTARESLLFSSVLDIQLLSAVTLHRTLPDGHTLYHCPTDPDFSPLLCHNTAAKLTACQSTADPALTFAPLPHTKPRKVVTRFKGTYVTGWLGQFRLCGDWDTLRLLYLTGLGDRNSQGFGMFDILRQYPTENEGM